MNNIAANFYKIMIKNNNNNYQYFLDQYNLTFTELNVVTYFKLSKYDKQFIFPEYLNRILKFNDGSILLIFCNETMNKYYFPLNLEKSYYIFDKIINYKKEKKESILKRILKIKKE